ncbi:PAS domain S-box protein [Ramlibacter tataouinensis]|uniref:histidine kinase n=1 Tax=Ramlibacter tataouinensis (strain ATCC BAA-407 / DSM 14655 / LMG 21543 / TTB310) TaxID=365046 RepID=F5Y486_RAMTT|nr:PAS domain S-box protein [Ramlibacter tataouinensis]AEG92551.1 candidate histidine kinase, hybrid [Ramlibacter tataouinensis TTB310]
MRSELTDPAFQLDDRHYRQIVDSALDYAIISCDERGRITTWNEGARRLLGWTAAEMMGQTLHRIFTPEDVAAGAVERELSTAMRERHALDERWHQRKGGERFWASGELMRVHDEEGRPAGLVKILRDRTEQRRHEAELQRFNETLRAGEQRLQLALDAGGLGVWQADLASGEVTWWPGMYLVHGMSPGAAPVPAPRYYDELVHPDDRARVVEAIQEGLRGSTGHRVEYRVLWPDGSVHWLEGRGHVLPDASGAAALMSGVCMDVTRRKNAENDLKFLAQASEELADVTDFQSTLDKIARLAVPGFADWCAVDMLADDGSLQRVAVAHVDPAKVELAHELHRRLPADPQAATGPWSVVREGRVAYVPEISDEMLLARIGDPQLLAAIRALGLRSYIGVPLSAHGHTLGVLTFVTAESRRRYTEDDLALAQDLARRAAVAIENAKLLRALRNSDRAKDVFLATLAHELRNPLAPIWNGLSIIKRVPGDAHRVEQVTGIIERQVGQLSRLVDDLLDVSRISTGKIELKKEPTSLVQVLTTAVEISRPHIEAAHHRLTLTFTDEPTDVYADPARMAQVFSNLLNNAAKYTRRGGRIDVAVEAQPSQLVVRVRDNGTGIAPEMQGKVFGLFAQATHQTERRQGGLGIGLSLVEGLVRLHGGRVEVRSEGLDRGSEFAVYLPRLGREQARTAAAPAQPAPPPGGGNRRVLVVEDNVDSATTVAELLSMSGNEVAVVHDGMTAVERTAAFRPDVVLLDIGLPDINGYEAARRIRKLEGVRQPMLIALTGWGQPQDKELAAQAGFDHHWTKPVDPARLQELASR